MFTDETFPIKQGSHHKLPSELAAVCGPSVLAVCEESVLQCSLLPSLSPNTGPSVQQQDCCSEEYKGESAVFQYISEGAGVSWLYCVSLLASLAC